MSSLRVIISKCTGIGTLNYSKRADSCKQYSSGQYGGWSVGRSVFYTVKPIQDVGDNKKDGKQEM